MLLTLSVCEQHTRRDCVVVSSLDTHFGGPRFDPLQRYAGSGQSKPQGRTSFDWGYWIYASK